MRFQRFSWVNIDLDGVLGDFHKAAAAAHGKPEIHRDNWPLPGAGLPRVLGFEADHVGLECTGFWKPLLEKESFFLSVDPFPWIHQLIELCRSYVGPHGVRIVTGPASGTEIEAREKMSWCTAQGIRGMEIKIEKEKWKLSQPGTILIDDWERQVDTFNEVAGGGNGILFPQPWNRNHHWSADPLGYVKHWLDHHSNRYS